jgi:hypothetical protein
MKRPLPDTATSSGSEYFDPLLEDLIPRRAIVTGERAASRAEREERSFDLGIATEASTTELAPA